MLTFINNRLANKIQWDCAILAIRLSGDGSKDRCLADVRTDRNIIVPWIQYQIIDVQISNIGIVEHGIEGSIALSFPLESVQLHAPAV
jgi:hypothetical protein